MLELRPNCEWCNKDLPPESDEAMICTYECTYCRDCVENVLQGVCATCGGNPVPRPIRPKQNYRASKALGLVYHPASTTRVHSRWSEDEAVALREKLKYVPPAER